MARASCNSNIALLAAAKLVWYGNVDCINALFDLVKEASKSNGLLVLRDRLYTLFQSCLTMSHLHIAS